MQQQNVLPQKVEKKIEGQGSAWNAGSYFWEEKSVKKWSEDTLKEILGAFKYNFDWGELKVNKVAKLDGEAAVNIRKGKKIVTYEYLILLDWDCTIYDGDKKEIGTLVGKWELPDCSHDVYDDGDEWEVNTSFREDKSNIQSRVEGFVKKDAVNALRKIIGEKFVEPLKKK